MVHEYDSDLDFYYPTTLSMTLISRNKKTDEYKIINKKPKPKMDNFELFRKRRFTNNRYNNLHSLNCKTQDDFSVRCPSSDDLAGFENIPEKSNQEPDNFGSVSSFDSLNDYSNLQPKEEQPQLRNRFHYVDDNDKLMIIDDDSLFPSSE